MSRSGAEQPATPATIDDLVVTAATLVGLVLTAGLLCCLGLALLEAMVTATRRSPAPWRCALTPQWSRRVVFALCGVSMMAPTVVATAPGATGDRGHHDNCAPACSGQLVGLPLPDLPATHHAVGVPTVHVVQRGECLWSIARDQLRGDGGRADTSATAEHVRRLYLTNRAVIGNDPDLIFPGTPLTAPEATP